MTESFCYIPEINTHCKSTILLLKKKKEKFAKAVRVKIHFFGNNSFSGNNNGYSHFKNHHFSSNIMKLRRWTIL